MTEEHGGTRPRPTDSPDEAVLADRRTREVVIDETSADHVLPDTPEQLAIVAALAIFTKAFLESLDARAGEGLADFVRTRRRRMGKTNEYLLGADDAATIAVTADLPDEARLALLDLDVAAPELRGRILRWDTAASAWRPSGALPVEGDGATPAS